MCTFISHTMHFNNFIRYTQTHKKYNNSQGTQLSHFTSPDNTPPTGNCRQQSLSMSFKEEMMDSQKFVDIAPFI